MINSKKRLFKDPSISENEENSSETTSESLGETSRENLGETTTEETEGSIFKFENTMTFLYSDSDSGSDSANKTSCRRDRRRLKRKTKLDTTKKTSKEELTDYVLSDFVGKSFVWKHLVTLPSIEFMQSIHEILSQPIKNKKLKQQLLHLDHEFFNLLELMYHYVVQGKTEDDLVKFTLHVSVSLLTEVVSGLAIDNADHTERLSQIYGIMLKLEKNIDNLLSEIKIKQIKTTLNEILCFLNNHFIVLDRVISVIYKNYIDKSQSIADDSSKTPEDLNKLKKINKLVTAFFGNIKKIKSKYPDHNFNFLHIEENIEPTSCNPDVFNTPEKQIKSKIKHHFTPPGKTPVKTNDEIKRSATYISDIIKEIKRLKQPILDKQKTKQSLADILELSEAKEYSVALAF
ncbi:MAG: hypothetical protein ACR2HS_06500 [Gammaproteobacteria bacterium]